LKELAEKPQSFSDIARKYGVSRQYVSKVAKPLLEAGIIEPCEQGYRLSKKGAVILSILTQTFDGLLYAEGFDSIVEDYLRWREEEDNSIKSMSCEEINRYYATRILYAQAFFYLYIYNMLTALMQAYVYTIVSRISSKKSLDTLLEDLWKGVIKPLIKSMLKVLKKYDILENIEMSSLYTQILLMVEEDLQTIKLLLSKTEKEFKTLLALKGVETIRTFTTIRDIIKKMQEAQPSK
jgi:DNA-binding Lrp family transcriptional regulator